MAPRRVTSEPFSVQEDVTTAGAAALYPGLSGATFVTSLPLHGDQFKFDVDEMLGFFFMFSHAVDPGFFHVHPIIGNEAQFDLCNKFNNLEIDRLNNCM